MRKGIFVLISIFVLCIMVPDRSYGLSVTYDYLFSGLITQEANLFDGTHLASPGDSFSGLLRYTYDPKIEPGGASGNHLEYYATFNDNAIKHTQHAFLTLTPLDYLSIGGLDVISSPIPNLRGNESFVHIFYNEPLPLDDYGVPFHLYPDRIDSIGFSFQLSNGGFDSDVFARADRLFPIGSPVAPVPEPATMLIFGAGLLGLAGIKKRIKN